ncbi:MAG: hypothetical protein Q9175_008214, partial [Cornicularia normoerica]
SLNGRDDSEKLLLGKTCMSFKLWEDEGHSQNLNVRSIVNALSAPKVIEPFCLLFDDQSDLNVNRFGFSFVLTHQLNRGWIDVVLPELVANGNLEPARDKDLELGD